MSGWPAIWQVLACIGRLQPQWLILTKYAPLRREERTWLTNDRRQLVDTSLARLLLGTPKEVSALTAILNSGVHAIDVDAIADLLFTNGLHWNLSQLYLRQGRVGEVLKIWTE